MPENPEIAHIVNQLHAICKECWTLYETDIIGGRYSRHGEPEDWSVFKYNLPLKWVDVNFKGKFIYFTFENKYGDKFFLWNTLAMTGNWSKLKKKHSHFVFRFRNNVKNRELYFNDPRNFGTIRVSFSLDDLLTKLKSIGKSWLEGNSVSTINVTIQDFHYALQSHENANICVFLIDQSILSGIGNYLLSEILYRSKISPYEIIKNITKEERNYMYNKITEVIRGSYELDGVSLKDYTGVDGEKGEYQHNLLVYGKKITKNNEKVVKEEGPHKRTIYYVPTVQKLKKIKS